MSKLAKLTFALVALSVLSALGACSAMAEEAVNVERWVVTSSGESSSLSAVTPEVRITDGSSEVICGESTIAGTIELGEEVLGRELAEVTSSTWGGGSCEGPLGIEFAIAQEGTWLLSADSGLAEGELVMGRLTNVAAKLRGAFCSLRVSGELGGEYSNSSQTLRVTSSSLLISEVSGCFGLVKNGDKPTFEATYEITSPTELALGVPLKLTAENVGGLPGAPNKCLYTLKFETCKIEVTNNSVFPVKIVKREVTGISAGARYKNHQRKMHGQPCAQRRNAADSRRQMHR